MHKGRCSSLTTLILLLVFIQWSSQDLLSMRGTWTWKTMRGEDATLKICTESTNTSLIQGRYTVDSNGQTRGFIFAKDQTQPLDAQQTELINQITTFTSHGIIVGSFYEPGGDIGQFELLVPNMDVNPVRAMLHIWYNDQWNTTLNQTTSLDQEKYRYYTQKAVITKTDSVVPASITDCWMSEPTTRTPTHSNHYLEGLWLRGSPPVSVPNTLYVCQHDTHVGGRALASSTYWSGSTFENQTIISGRWIDYSTSKRGNMLLKWVDNQLVGFFLEGITNLAISTLHILIDPSATPLTRHQIIIPSEMSQCIEPSLGAYTGQWTETIHNETMYICTREDGKLIGSYEKTVLVNDQPKTMPIAVIRGQVNSTNYQATGIWYEAGNNQNGQFVWQINTTDFSYFTGRFWSGPEREGVGREWNENRKTWVASWLHCLDEVYLESNRSLTTGVWSMPQFTHQIEPYRQIPFKNLQLQVCQDEAEQSTVGIYRWKGDWQGNWTIDGSIVLAYFKEHWEPLGVKIAGNVLLRMMHDNFSVAHHFENENADDSKIGHFRTHTRLLPDGLTVNCTPIFPSSAHPERLSQHGSLWILYLVVLVATSFSML